MPPTGGQPPDSGQPTDSGRPDAQEAIPTVPSEELVPSGTPGIMLLVATATPAVAAIAPDGQRPIVLPTPTPTPDVLLAAARSFDTAATTLGWLWFLVGSLIFSVSAGVAVGLFFRQAERDRFALYTVQPQPEEELSPPPTRPRPSRAAPPSPDEDEWPTDLP